MKSLISRFINKLSTVRILINFLLLRRIKNKNLVVFDIDNTIADTWPNLRKSEIDFSQVYKTVMLFPNMKKLILELQNENFEIIFLSARHLGHYNTTKAWLLENSLPSKYLFLVWKVEQKLEYLNDWSKQNNVFYLDDLSYNHEEGEIKYYESIIEKVRRFDLVYYDYSSILSIRENPNKVNEVLNEIKCSKN